MTGDQKAALWHAAGRLPFNLCYRIPRQFRPTTHELLAYMVPRTPTVKIDTSLRPGK